MSTRDAYLEKLKAKLDEWNAEIDRLEAKSRGAEASVRAEYERKLGELRDLRDDARCRADKLESAGEDAWEEMKGGFEEFWNRTKSAFETAAAAMR